jgi:hypothetical protein
MTDLFFIATALGFFGLFIAYAYGCERLRAPAGAQSPSGARERVDVNGGDHD